MRLSIGLAGRLGIWNHLRKASCKGSDPYKVTHCASEWRIAYRNAALHIELQGGITSVSQFNLHAVNLE